jgi:hypothetical protein
MSCWHRVAGGGWGGVSQWLYCRMAGRGTPDVVMNGVPTLRAYSRQVILMLLGNAAASLEGQPEQLCIAMSRQTTSK